jgi:hypothetical protein
VIIKTAWRHDKNPWHILSCNNTTGRRESLPAHRDALCTVAAACNTKLLASIQAWEQTPNRHNRTSHSNLVKCDVRLGMSGFCSQPPPCLKPIHQKTLRVCAPGNAHPRTAPRVHAPGSCVAKGSAQAQDRTYLCTSKGSSSQPQLCCSSAT